MLPKKKRRGIVEETQTHLAGSALAEKSFSSPRRRPGPEALNAMLHKKKRSRIVNRRPFAGPALEEKSFSSPRHGPEPAGLNAILPEKKRSRIVNRLQTKLAGPALAEESFSSPRRRPGPEASNVILPEKKRSRIVVAKSRRRGREAHHLGPIANYRRDLGNGFGTITVRPPSACA
jgi:hypothetical protein